MKWMVFSVVRRRCPAPNESVRLSVASSKSWKRSKWACLFVTDEGKRINKHIYQRDPTAKFGALTKIWRDEHCDRINPYGSDDCPYTMAECAAAYFRVWQGSRNIGHFRIRSKRLGMIRAENKPRDTRVVQEDYDEGWGMYRRLARPKRLGELLGPLDAGPRKGSAEDGGESPF
jgi:hypothetical protein